LLAVTLVNAVVADEIAVPPSKGAAGIFIGNKACKPEYRALIFLLSDSESLGTGWIFPALVFYIS
jgi:hypothetical protein